MSGNESGSEDGSGSEGGSWSEAGTGSEASTSADGRASIHAIVAGPDEHGLGEELGELGVTVSRIDDAMTATALREAGVETATYLVVTDVEEATGIAVAKEHNPDIVVVAYADRSLPEYVAAVGDLAIDPSLLGADVVAEELAAGSAGKRPSGS